MAVSNQNANPRAVYLSLGVMVLACLASAGCSQLRTPDLARLMDPAPLDRKRDQTWNEESFKVSPEAMNPGDQQQGKSIARLKLPHAEPISEQEISQQIPDKFSDIGARQPSTKSATELLADRQTQIQHESPGSGNPASSHGVITLTAQTVHQSDPVHDSNPARQPNAEAVNGSDSGLATPNSLKPMFRESEEAAVTESNARPLPEPQTDLEELATRELNLDEPSVGEHETGVEEALEMPANEDDADPALTSLEETVDEFQQPVDLELSELPPVSVAPQMDCPLDDSETMNAEDHAVPISPVGCASDCGCEQCADVTIDWIPPFADCPELEPLHEESTGVSTLESSVESFVDEFVTEMESRIADLPGLPSERATLNKHGIESNDFELPAEVAEEPAPPRTDTGERPEMPIPSTSPIQPAPGDFQPVDIPHDNRAKAVQAGYVETISADPSPHRESVETSASPGQPPTFESGQTRALELNNAAFCSRVVGFGQFETMTSNEFPVGQQVLVYCEVENFDSRLVGDGRFCTRLSGGFKITDETGAVIQQTEFPAVDDFATSKRHDFYIHFPVALDLPRGGTYLLHLTVTDCCAGNESARLHQPLRFTIR